MPKDNDIIDDCFVHSTYSVTRQVYSVDKFSEQYPRSEDVRKQFSIFRILKSFTLLKLFSIFSFIFPFYSVLSSFYTFQSFLSDIVAGLTMSIVHIPQGMAYGLLAGVKPVNGLYTSFFPALVYFFFGTSRHVSIGTFSVVSLLTADPVDKLISRLDVDNRSLEKYQVFNESQLDDFRLRVVVTVCILAGLLQLILGTLRLGVLVVYMSEPLLSGFTCASAVHVFASQLNGLFGIRLNRATGPGRIFYIIINFVQIINKTNFITLFISAVCIVIIWVFKHFINPKVMAKIRFAIPIELIILVIGTVVSQFCLLNEKYGVTIVGEIPVGLPTPILPDVQLIPEVIMESVIVSFVAFATTISLVKLYATKHGYDVGYTQELNALGLSNIISGFFRCQPSSGALARTSVAYGVGMCSQVASLVSCCILLLVLTVVGQFLKAVPMCVLSSIIVVSLESIFLQITDLPKLYRASIYDMLIWLVTFLATTFIDVPIGLVIGLCFSLLTVLYRTQSSYYYELGQIPNTNIYVDVKKYDEAIKLPNIIILKYGGPLYYANAEFFQNWLNKMTEIYPHKMKKHHESKQQQQQQHHNEENNNQYPLKKSKHFSALDKLCNRLKCKRKTSESILNTSRISCNTHLDKLNDACNQLKFIILDISSWTYLDVVGMHIVTDVVKSYRELGIRILFTVCEPQIKSMLTSGSITLSQIEHNSFISIHDAVVYCQNILSDSNSCENIMTATNSNIFKDNSIMNGYNGYNLSDNKNILAVSYPDPAIVEDKQTDIILTTQL
ncbi:unnamed protein product [Heterobilharzia americana]|nr:unnamed protein product [Heterobilharzia americana]